MKLNIFCAIFLFVVLVTSAASAQVCVDARNETGVPDGTAARPYRTVQAGVDAAVSGQSVLVATGTYAGDVRIENKTVLLEGGYAGGSAVQYAGAEPGDFGTRSPDPNLTALMGTGAESVVTLLDAGTSTVDGFRITGGGGSTIGLPYASNGGGIYASGGAPTVRNNLIEGNDPRRPDVPDASAFGGGICSVDADITIEGNDISENIAERGAGIAAVGGVVIIRNNTVRGNVGHGDHGGGMYIGSPDATITNNRVFENEIGRTLGYGWGGGIIVFNPGNHADLSFNEWYSNYAPGHGAGVFVDEGATATLTHERVHHNEVDPGDSGGGAVYVDGGVFDDVPMGSVVSIVNCTIAENPIADITLGGNGLFVEGYSEVTVRNSILWGNDPDEIWNDDNSSVEVTYSDIAGGEAGVGNLASDPRLADAAAGDFHLMSTAGRWDPAAKSGAFVIDAVQSPCIDAGDPADAFDNEPLPNGGRINMGAYGDTAEASLSGDGGEGEGCSQGASVANGRETTRGDIALLAVVVGMLGVSRRHRRFHASVV